MGFHPWSQQPGFILHRVPPNQYRHCLFVHTCSCKFTAYTCHAGRTDYRVCLVLSWSLGVTPTSQQSTHTQPVVQKLDPTTQYTHFSTKLFPHDLSFSGGAGEHLRQRERRRQRGERETEGRETETGERAGRSEEHPQPWLD